MTNEPGKYNTITLVGGGIGISGLMLGGFSAMGGALPGVIMGGLMAVTGVIMIVVGVKSRWGEGFGDPTSKPVRREMNVYVIAKVIEDEKSEFVLDAELRNPEDVHHLVKLEFSNGKKFQFETSAEVYDDVGDGMHGDIVYQGKWLSQFTFRPKDGDRKIGEDPFRAGKL